MQGRFGAILGPYGPSIERSKLYPPINFWLMVSVDWEDQN